jgi:ABC-type multidrug transport system fused ATPase/permease subunit
MGRNNPRVNRDTYTSIPGAEANGTAPDEANKDHISMARLLAEARPQLWTLVAGTGALFASAGANLAIPALFGRVIDALTNQSDTAESNHKLLLTEILLLIGVTAISAIFSFLRSYLFTVAGERVVASLRLKLFAALMVSGYGGNCIFQPEPCVEQ